MNEVHRGSANDCIIPFGYELQISPADSTTYYMGLFLPSAIQGLGRIWIPRSGTITRVDLNHAIFTTVGSSEDITLSVRKNNTTDYTVSSTMKLDSSLFVPGVTTKNDLAVPVVAGDYIEIKMVTPAFATNPVDVLFNGSIYLQ